jgi:PTH1 family peptidyl-tRNA hydrolase
MEMTMNKIIVGLGNPDKKYNKTRHNAGFLVVDELAVGEGMEWQQEKKFKSLVAQNDEFILVKPQTGMNLSGEAVIKVVSYYKVALEKLFVVHDDVDFISLTYKLQFGKESAGHKGVEDIINRLGTKDFWRVRVGVGRPQNRSFEVEDFILSRFEKDEIGKIAEITSKILLNIKQS